MLFTSSRDCGLGIFSKVDRTLSTGVLVCIALTDWRTACLADIDAEAGTLLGLFEAMGCG